MCEAPFKLLIREMEMIIVNLKLGLWISCCLPARPAASKLFSAHGSVPRASYLGGHRPLTRLWKGFKESVNLNGGKYVNGH